VRECGGDAKITKGVDDLQKFDGLILPGVGSFEVLRRCAPLAAKIKKFAACGKPLLGICLGMQALFEKSWEAPGVRGFGLLKGDVRKICGRVRLPQMGWNRLKVVRKCRLLEGIGSGAYVYFANSYSCFPKDEEVIVVNVEYGKNIVAAVEKENVYGVQFHPEKSGVTGLRIIENFVKMVEECR
jgi:glutamine amidotransferase